MLRSKFSNFTLCAKYITIDLKKHIGVIFHDTEDWCKVWRETDLWFGKWHEEFDNCLREHSKVSKLTLWWDTFIQSRSLLSLKFTEELYIMKMKNDAKFRNWLVVSKWQHNLTNFDPSTQNSQMVAL